MPRLAGVIATEVNGKRPSEWTDGLHKKAQVQILPHPRVAGWFTLRIGNTRLSIVADEMIAAVEASTQAQNSLFHLGLDLGPERPPVGTQPKIPDPDQLNIQEEQHD